MSEISGHHPKGMIYFIDEAAEIPPNVWAELMTRKDQAKHVKKCPVLIGVDLAKPGDDFTGSRAMINE